MESNHTLGLANESEKDADVPLNIAASRPNTLNILLDNSLKSPILPSFNTPIINELQPFLRTEVEKFLQQWKSSPQTPGTFLNPKNVTEEQERFANVFTQKLNELKEQSCLASISAALSPSAVANTSNNIYNVNFPDLTAQNMPTFADLCRKAVEQQSAIASTPSILFYSPAAFTNQYQSETKESFANQCLNADGHKEFASQNMQHEPVSITLPANFMPGKESKILHLANGLRLEITNDDASHASILKLLGVDPSLSDHVKSRLSETSENNPNSILWPLQIQTSSRVLGSPSREANSATHLTSPRDENDTRPSSIDNSIDFIESGPPMRSTSSVSSLSSVSQHNGTSKKDGHSYLDLNDSRLDPNEQSRMRLERKRARNRDAARKCRERKIRLIKSLEKEVNVLSEENKGLRNRLSRSRFEVERLQLFVVNHLDKECPLLASKVS